MRNLDIKEYKNKYRIVAEQIHLFLGKNNYSNPYHCQTRIRVAISNKDQVDLEAIKKLELVKGTRWNGDELQIIIGSEVVKVTDELKNYIFELTQTDETKTKQKTTKIKAKVSFGTKVMMGMSGIVAPVIPLLMAMGMISALQAILLQANVITNIGDMNKVAEADLFSGIFFIMSKVILNVIGVFFIYSTARYFNGNKMFALAVGITLVCRGLFPSDIGVDYADAKFGDWIIAGNGIEHTQTLGKTGWLLFRLGDFPVTVTGYEGSIIPFIVGGVLVTYLDKWIKSWIHPNFDIVFRPMLVYFLSLIGLWFVLAPVFGLIEFALAQAVTWIGNIPFGIGIGLFALLWQPLVLTGTHVAIGTIIQIPFWAGEPSALVPGMPIAVFGQLGAVIAVAVITKNMNLRRIAIGSIPAAVFGITEPTIYTVNLPKVRPFLFGCLGALAGGLLSGWLGLHVNVVPGQGIFFIVGFTEGAKQIALVLLTWVLTIGVGFTLTLFFYKERKDEVSYFKKGVSKIIKFINGDKTQINEQFKNLEDQIKAMKKDYEKMSKYYSEISKYENQLMTIENKESKHRENLYRKLVKLKTKLSKKDNEILGNKFDKLNQEYSSYNLDQKKVTIKEKLNKAINLNEQLLETFNQRKTKIYQESSQKVDHYLTKEIEVMVVDNIMWNALNSVEIGFGIEDAKPAKFKKAVK